MNKDAVEFTPWPNFLLVFQVRFTPDSKTSLTAGRLTALRPLGSPGKGLPLRPPKALARQNNQPVASGRPTGRGSWEFIPTKEARERPSRVPSPCEF